MADRPRTAGEGPTEADHPAGDDPGADVPEAVHHVDAPWPRPGPAATERAPGWREVLAVAAAIVAGVLALAVLTSVLPTGLQEIVFRTPLAIAVLLVVTIGLLARLGRGSAS